MAHRCRWPPRTDGAFARDKSRAGPADARAPDISRFALIQRWQRLDFAPMKPFTHTLLDIFGMDVRYVVPLYQRPYVWQKHTHWEPLWEDVQVVLESQENGEPRSHFLGAIVLEQLQTAPGDVHEWLVID